MKKLALGTIAASALLVSNVMAQGKADEMFSKMDTNKDGKISADEHAAAAKARFDKMDKNHDGKIVIADELKAPNKPDRGQATAQGEMAMDYLKSMDTNGDGAISAEEHATAAKARFDKMDTNKDGFLTKEEMAAGRTMIMDKAK